MKIRNKIVLSFLLVAFLSAFLFFLTTKYVSEKVMTELIGNYNTILAETSSNSINNVIYSRLERWEAYAQSNSDLRQTLASSNNDFDQMADRDAYIKNQDEAWKNSGSQKDNEFMRSIMESPISSELRNQTNFYEEKYDYNVFAEFFITNKYGVNIAQTGKTSDYYQADEEWWQKTRDEKIYISDVVYDESSNIYALEICLRIDDSKKNFLGVAKVVYDIEDIFRVIDEIAEEPEGESHTDQMHFSHETVNAYLINEKGELIYSIKGGFGNFSDKKNFLEKFKIIEGEHRPYIIFEEDGDEKLFSHVHLKGYKDFQTSGWILVISKNTEEVLQPVANIIRGVEIASASSLIIAILTGLFLSSYLARPIRKLLQGTQIIEKGDLDYKVSIKSKDEIGQLSRSFDAMIVAIKKSRAEVDLKVAEQTEEIKQKAENLKNQQLAILNILEDVDEERENNHREREKLYTILHSIGDGVFVVDSDLRIVMINHMIEEISGFNAGELVGKKYYEILKFICEADGKEIETEFVKEAILSGKTKEMPSRTFFIQKNGKKIPVANSSAPLKNDKGEVVGCVIVFRDISHEYQIDKAKTEFVSFASHQLRTPLSAINWYAEMLIAGDAGKLSDQQKSFMDEIYKGNQRMVELVNSLLDVSRIELGTLSIEPKPTDFGKVASDMVKELVNEIKTKQLKIKESYAKDLPLINADPSLTRIIFQNIITNAVKYTPENGKITIKLEKEDKNLLIKISDTGYGIPKNQQDKIFQKLFRADNVREKDTNGSGLGLYLVKSIVEQSSGEVWFESKENKGTTFFVHIPLSGMRKKEGSKTLNKEKI